MRRASSGVIPVDHLEIVRTTSQVLMMMVDTEGGELQADTDLDRSLEVISATCGGAVVGPVALQQGKPVVLGWDGNDWLIGRNS